MLRFDLLATEATAEGQARRGRLALNHGVVKTPTKMFVQCCTRSSAAY